MDKGVLIMAYGSPKDLDDVERYYTHIRRGKRPSDEEIMELKERYMRIGGTSPLYDITFNIAKKLQKSLNGEYKVFVGMKHSPPFIDETVSQMYNEGIKKAIGMVLAPHYSKMSVEEYLKVAREKARELGMEFFEIKNYHLEPELLELWKTLIGDMLKNGYDLVIFSAHSLPERILKWDDPYPKQLLEMAERLAEELNIKNWRFAYQSAGKTNEPWLGPDILEVLEEAKNSGFSKILIAPIGFLSDHLEVLYDIDIECVDLGKELCITVSRTPMPNDHPILISLLSRLVRENL